MFCAGIDAGPGYEPYVQTFGSVSNGNNWPTGWSSSGGTKEGSGVARISIPSYGSGRISFSLSAYPNHRGGTISASASHDDGDWIPPGATFSSLAGYISWELDLEFEGGSTGWVQIDNVTITFY